MKVFSYIPEIKAYLHSQKKLQCSIGFVPTMGALHAGHLSLIEKAKSENDICVCSIFVNPIQFNNLEDLKKYPVQKDQDLDLLREKGCDVVFCPENKEMYPEAVEESYDFGPLEKMMEGAFRPGHFNGVAVVVKRLFDIVTPDKAYFGEKDFQQLQIIRSLVKQKKLPVTIVACPIVRDVDGLALSSRNALLTEEHRRIAPQIAALLHECSLLAGDLSVAQLKAYVQQNIAATPEFVLDYFEIACEETLQPIETWAEAKKIRAFIAVYLGKVRLIDNIGINL
ncbi:MAG TPA: pantoate--beta-alanine ligase [Bacteroidales bacterium]|nr:pantoate--beta-alanine ligase [Bacteroidales bacterium]HQI69297.1 pantoate--beta-alanine ligase [Bacteroidales bacterium]